jgi:hypothetical protein
MDTSQSIYVSEFDTIYSPLYLKIHEVVNQI